MPIGVEPGLGGTGGGNAISSIATRTASIASGGSSSSAFVDFQSTTPWVKSILVMCAVNATTPCILEIRAEYSEDNSTVRKIISYPVSSRNEILRFPVFARYYRLTVVNTGFAVNDVTTGNASGTIDIEAFASESSYTSSPFYCPIIDNVSVTATTAMPTIRGSEFDAEGILEAGTPTGTSPTMAARRTMGGVGQTRNADDSTQTAAFIRDRSLFDFGHYRTPLVAWQAVVTGTTPSWPNTRLFIRVGPAI